MSLQSRRNLLKRISLTWLGAAAHTPEFGMRNARANSNESTSFDFENVKKIAGLTAKHAYVPDPPLPKPIDHLTYDLYRMIAFRHERALWTKEDLPFRTELHHRGFVHTDKVELKIVDCGRVVEVPFDSNLFQYRGPLADLQVPHDAGYAGLRFLCVLPERENFQEFVSFLGASYFRAIPSHEVYGTSARGIAVNIALPQPEEFPKFRTLWFEKPQPDAKSMRMWALLDGPSVAGAYEFVITPGLHETALAVKAHLYFRTAVAKLGLGPLTSMWMWDENTKPADDHRGQVHDADGLLIHAASGEWLWRPLRNPKAVNVASYRFGGVKGFGLLQRERRLEIYNDKEALYHRRPGVWIEPDQDWGPGAVELLELPSDSETNDNVAAYWTPEKQPQAGDELAVSYRIDFGGRDPRDQVGVRVLRTSISRPSADVVDVELEWIGGRLSKLASDVRIEPVVSTSVGKITNLTCAAGTGAARIVRFQLHIQEGAAAELRVFLRHGSDAISETWSYLC